MPCIPRAKAIRSLFTHRTGVGFPRLGMGTLDALALG